MQTDYSIALLTYTLWRQAEACKWWIVVWEFEKQAVFDFQEGTG